MLFRDNENFYLKILKNDSAVAKSATDRSKLFRALMNFNCMPAQKMLTKAEAESSSDDKLSTEIFSFTLRGCNVILQRRYFTPQ